MDLSILGWTGVAVLLRRDVAVDRSTGRLGLRRRPPREESVSLPATQLGLKHMSEGVFELSNELACDGRGGAA